jgi:hypothetical protein
LKYLLINSRIMKPFFLLCNWLAVASLFFFLSACRKVAEILRKDPDAIGQFCRIDTFSFGSPVGPTQQTVVSYNWAGDPVAILPKFVTTLEVYDDIYFRYDRFGRLRDVILVVPAGTTTAAIDQWRRFTYPRPGLVIDSFLNYDGPGVPLGPAFTLPKDPPPYITADVSGYEQDERGRTVRRWTVFPNFTGMPQPVDTVNILYDRKGNQVRPGIGYDDKINIYRTNKVWQLLFQDYSTNNPVIFSNEFPMSDISSYNRWGLPKLFVETEGLSNATIFFYPFYLSSDIQVSYSCDGGGDLGASVAGGSGG